MKTIIDNCVWYQIEKDKANLSKIEIVNPHVQNLNIDELSRSYNLVYSTDRVRRCIQIAMKLCQNRLIGQNPFVYLLNLDGQLLGHLTDHDEFIIELTSDLAKGALIDQSRKEEILSKWIAERDSELKAISDAYGEITDNIKANFNLTKQNLSFKMLRPFVIELLKENISNWTIANLQKEYSLSKDFDFCQIELFIKCYASFYKSILNSSGKYKPHDSYDLYQLIYVQPGDKYWTIEKKWQNIIYEQAKCPEYLFEYRGTRIV